MAGLNLRFEDSLGKFSKFSKFSKFDVGSVFKRLERKIGHNPPPRAPACARINFGVFYFKSGAVAGGVPFRVPRAAYRARIAYYCTMILTIAGTNASTLWRIFRSGTSGKRALNSSKTSAHFTCIWCCSWGVFWYVPCTAAISFATCLRISP